MASLNARASAGRLRVYKPAVQDDGAPLPKEQEHDRTLLLDKIRQHYGEALRRLTVRWRSDMLARLLDVGICLGLLDPPSNIIANTLLAATAPVGRAEALVDVGDGAKLRAMERRSLDGLVAFLTCFFPYLAAWEAVRYLLLAEADPLVAVRIVAEDRGLKRFVSGSDGALKLALRCAALAAEHPRAAELADTWVSLSSESDLLDKAVSLLSDVQRNFPRNILHSFRRLVKETAAGPPPPRLLRPWELAAGRSKVTEVPYQHSRSLRRVLLDTIHGFYLQALARLPAGELRSRYHRSLLNGGHCYGPFDPVSNIILNTIWYEAAFPPRIPEAELDMIGTLSLMRIEARSFYGLVSFLCTRHQNLNLHQALRYLVETNLNLLLSDPSLGAAVISKLEQQQQPPCTCSSVQEAFRAAAIAAWHPKPDAQVEFLSSCEAMLAPAYLSLLQDRGQQLSSQDTWHLARLLCSNKSPSVGMPPQQQPVSISRRRFNVIMADGKKQRRALRRISGKVKAALRRYGNQNSQPPNYQLHVICGVNEFVSGPDYCEGSSLKKENFNGCYAPDHVYHHIHANFLVTRNVGGIASDPILFFAELSNDDDDDRDRQLLCCPVDLPAPCAEAVRCLFCEHEGIRIVHPAWEGFHGREVEFEKMVRGEDLYNKEQFDPGLYAQVYTNRRMLKHSELVAEWMQELREDRVYLHSNDFTIEEDDDEDSDSDY